ncbi:N-acetylmuramoyl-L-alanine amidase, partial [Fischerella thermalis WC217]
MYSVVTPENSNTPPANKGTLVSANTSTTQIESLRITGDGFFVRTSGSRPQVKVNRSQDKSTVDIDITGASLSPNLVQQNVNVNRYGVGSIQFTQLTTTPPTVRITMRVNKSSPDWRASTSAIGGLVLL